MSLGLDDAEKIRELVAQPLVETMRAELRTMEAHWQEKIALLTSDQQQLKACIVCLTGRMTLQESFRRKIAWVSTTVAVAAGISGRYLFDLLIWLVRGKV